MIDKELHAEFDEYYAIFSEHHKQNSTAFILTEKVIEEFVGFRVKEISSHIPIEFTLEEQRKYIDNRLCQLFIIGSAFPMLEGWKMFCNKETNFIARGFKDELVPFKFNFGPGFCMFSIVDEVDESTTTSYHMFVEYLEETAKAMSDNSHDLGGVKESKFS